MDIPAYLDRIGYSGPLEPTGAVLRALQRRHLYSVPFENLDIGLGRPLHLEEAALFEKIVTRRRGGFCYELNGLFWRLLERLGYRVNLLTASSANDDGSYSAEFDHLVLQVSGPDAPELGWLVDVGWGDGPLEPLRLGEPGEQRQGGRVFRLEPQAGQAQGAAAADHAAYFYLRELTSEGKWLEHYRFNLAPHAFEEFFGMCQYHQTAPQSIFVQKQICTIYTEAGRATISGLRLILTSEQGGPRGSGERVERQLSGEEELRRELRERFGVHFDNE